MCTITWWQSPDLGAYEVFFNRDERRSRGAAKPPVLVKGMNADYVAPADAGHGGTWLLVNEHGVTLALLNCYPREANVPEVPRSRGKLVRDLAGVKSVEALERRLRREEMACYGGFNLLAFGRGENTRQWRWDTHELKEIPAEISLPIQTTSSSLSGEEIAEHRRNLFAQNWAGQGRLEPKHLAEFHLHQEMERPGFGILMDRPDARTVSVSRLVVGPDDEAVYTYQSRPMEDGALLEAAQAVHLPLAVESAESAGLS